MPSIPLILPPPPDVDSPLLLNAGAWPRGRDDWTGLLVSLSIGRIKLVKKRPIRLTAPQKTSEKMLTRYTDRFSWIVPAPGAV